MIYFFLLIFAQIVLEALPVSSSGQIILLENIFDLIHKDACFSLSSNKIISYFLHGPTFIVVALFFFNRWFFLLLHIRKCWKIILKLFFFIFVADVITFFFFLLFNNICKAFFFPLGIGFLISAFALLSLLFCSRDTKGKVTLRRAILLGIVQGCSLLPGISRLGTTFVAARWMGISPRRSFEFSFAMQWPLIVAGFLYSLRFMLGPFFYAYVYFFSLDVLLFFLFSATIAFFTLSFLQRIVLEKRMWMFSIFLSLSFITWVFLKILY